MTIEEKKIIREYLCGPRNYAEGVSLYIRFGNNRMLQRRFTLEETGTTKQLLAEELRKLADLTPEQFARLPRRAKTVTETVAAEPAPTKEEGRRPIPETVTKMARFREQFPFLNSPDCPDCMKIMVADMFTAYGAYRDAYARLQAMPDAVTAESAKEAQTIVENYLADREMWAALEAYRDSGTLPVEESVDDSPELMNDVDLVKALQNARANVSKKKRQAKAKLSEEAEAQLTRWTERRDALEAELNARKKKQ